MFKPIVVALALVCACNFVASGVAGSGVAASEQRQVAAFEQLAVEGSFAVEVEVGPAPGVRVEADDNIIPRIVTEVAGTTLTISSRGNFHTARPIVVHVTTPRLVGVDHSGSGRVGVRGVAGDRFTAALSGSGSIELAGATDTLVARVDGSGALAAAELVTGSATVELSGSGGVEVHVRERLVARVDGSGSVRYAGGPKDVVRAIDGSGSVAPM